MGFGLYLKQRRKYAGLTLEVAAKTIGLSLSNLSDIEKGRRRAPNRKRLIKLEDVYGLRKNDLLRCAIDEATKRAARKYYFRKI